MVGRWLAICLGAIAAGFAAPGAFAQPAAIPGSPVRSEPSLPTDGLMSPAPTVPPRTAFQRPMPAPIDDPRDLNLPNGAVIPVPQAPGQKFSLAPRYGRRYNSDGEKLPDGSQRIFVTGGVIVNVSAGPGKPGIEFATDNAVIWIHGKDVNSDTAAFETDPEKKQEVEIYMSGNVVIRTTSPATSGQPFMQTLRAEQVYYDVSKSRAIALAADLELSNPKVPDGIHLTGREIRQLDLENWEVLKGSAFSTKLLPVLVPLRLKPPADR